MCITFTAGVSIDLYPPNAESVIGCVESTTFNEEGGKFCSFEHGVTVVVPSGAIPTGIISEMKFSAALNAPIKLSNNAIRVSAIIWLCMNVPLKKHIKLQIQHHVNVKSEAHSKKLQFVKAKYHLSNNETVKSTEVIEEGIFPVGKSYGMIEISHFCYYCIELIQESDIPDNLYRVVTVKELQPDIERNLWIIYVCIIPSLSTCLKVIIAFFDAM